jgi:hypothetical protein
MVEAGQDALQVREPSAILARVHLEDDAPLLEIVRTRRAARGFTRPRQGGQQDGRQYADNGDDQQQLDQRETGAVC